MRNLSETRNAQLTFVCDMNRDRMAIVERQYPGGRVTDEPKVLFVWHRFSLNLFTYSQIIV